MPDKQQNTITIPMVFYELLVKDNELVRHLTYYRGYGWLEAVREELANDKKYKLGVFGKCQINSH